MTLHVRAVARVAKVMLGRPWGPRCLAWSVCDCNLYPKPIVSEVDNRYVGAQVIGALRVSADLGGKVRVLNRRTGS